MVLTKSEGPKGTVGRAATFLSFYFISHLEEERELAPGFGLTQPQESVTFVLRTAQTSDKVTSFVILVFYTAPFYNISWFHFLLCVLFFCCWDFPVRRFVLQFLMLEKQYRNKVLIK